MRSVGRRIVAVADFQKQFMQGRSRVVTSSSVRLCATSFWKFGCRTGKCPVVRRARSRSRLTGILVIAIALRCRHLIPRTLVICGSVARPAALVFAAMLMVLGSPSTASAAGNPAWYIHLHSHDPYASGPTDADFYGGPYASKTAAIAALKQLDPKNLYAGEPLIQEQSISAMTASYVTYQFVAPVATPLYGAWSFYWCLYPTQQPCYPPSGYSFPDEATAVAAANHGICSLNGGSPTTSYVMTSAGNWMFYNPSGSGSPGSDTTQRRPYSWTTQSFNVNTNACDPPQTSSVYLEADRNPSCPAGYYLSFDTSPQWHYVCQDAYTGYVTGPLKECPAGTSASTEVGDPCDVSTGDFTQTETDYSAAGLAFSRYYHSATLESGRTLGVGWTHNYASYLVLASGIPVGLLRPDGHEDPILSVSGEYVSLSGAGIHVQQSGSNWIAYLGNGSSEVYSNSGQLVQKVSAGGQVTTFAYNGSGLLSSVTGPFGHMLQFTYDSSNRLSAVTEPDGTSTIRYAYDSNNNLSSVTYPDSTVREYQYQNTSFPNNITGILDESTTLFLTVTYDPTTGSATSSQQANGAQAVSMVYAANSATVTDSLGATNTYTFTTDPNFSPRVTSLSRNGLLQSYVVPPGSTDPQQRVTQSTDANGNVTTYAYDTDHLTSKTEASGTLIARTTSYQYLATNTALPTLVTEPLRQTAYAYYSGTNNVHTKTIADTTVTPNVARTWTYVYDSYGRVLTVKGPRTDVNSTTTYTYYTCTTGVQCGQVQTVTDALGHVTTYSTYNAHGQPLTITDLNGVVTTLTYDSRLRLTSRQVGTETTGFGYWPTGLLKQVTLPDSSYLTYTYDGAHRLTQITDQAGYTIKYTLDGMGNRTAENSYDPSSVLHRTHTRVINALNQIYKEINAAGTAAVTTTFGYDNNGNQTSIQAPLSRNTTNIYDALNRLSQITDPANGITKFGYDANDSLTSVKDPRNFTTGYTPNGFGDVTQLTSPDSGTIHYTYDSGGNLYTASDARGATSTSSYDALNRVTSVAYALNGVTDQTISYTYDVGGGYGKGRLTGAADANHSVGYMYDALGRVTSKTQTTGPIALTVGYTYTNGDLTTLTTPSGKAITYGYNSNHQVVSVTVGSITVLTGATYEPFGGVNGWTWGNGTATVRAYNTDGNVSTISSAASKTYGYDNANRISGITDNGTAALSWTYGYDAVDRVNSASTSTQSISFTFDANGNRKTQGGTVSTTFNVATNSNQLTSVSGGLTRTYSYNTSGNTSGYSGMILTYNARERLVLATNNGATVGTYVYDALGQRIQKSTALGTTYFAYDESGHLIGEYDVKGALIQEIAWLGDTPVATIRNEACGLSVFYIHTDHLNTPRRISRRSTADIVWSWESDPFGSAGPNENPSGLGTFPFNLRFAGQYFDVETGLNQNYFRDYDPQVGRYVESDPIGLRSGINTYAYARGNPVRLFDRYGLLPGDCYPTENAAGANAVNDINWTSIQTNTEYAGRIYQNSDGTYSYTAPIPGTDATSGPGPLTPNSVGTYHTHGANVPGYLSEGFSSSDVSFSISEGLFIPGYVAYLGTPFGVIKGFDPHSYIGDSQVGQFWNLPYPSPGGNVPCSCTKPK
jgi:RHS repeat-associated protein